MKDLISVVVPIYNVAPYLEKCIDSILNQTYKNMEIILVDDGSTDGGAQICDDYAGKYDKIKVIHQENSKLTVTRRNGVNLAQGEYVGFVDGDDWIECDMYQRLYEHICSQDVDIVTSRGYREYAWGTGETTLGDFVPTGRYEISMDEDYILRRLFPGVNEGHMNGGVWNKLFRADIIRDVLNEIDDNVHGYLDDTVCVAGSIMRAKSIYVSQDVLYHHREREDSFTYSKNMKGLIQVNYGYLSLKKLVEDSPYKEKVLPDLLKHVSKLIIDASSELLEKDDYMFPRHFFKCKKIPMGSKVLLYGAGKVGSSYWRQLKAEGKYELLGIIDKDEDKCSDLDMIYGINKIGMFKFDFVIIAIKNITKAEEVQKYLVQKGIPDKKIIWERPLSAFEYFF